MIVEFSNPDSLAECLIADELSRLRDEVKALRADRDALLQQIVADYPPIEAELEEVSDRAFKAEAERDALRVVQPSAFDPVAAMRLADDYAFAQSELDGEHSTSRKYYVDSRDEARTALAVYLGNKK